jgi:hypothetical protein
MNLYDRIRVLLGIGNRRDILKVGDRRKDARRRPKDVCEAEARGELDDLAWIKWKGERNPIERPEQEDDHSGT